VKNQEILKHLLSFLLTQNSPKKGYNGITSSQKKYEIYNLQFYKNLRQNIEFMLKETEKMIETKLDTKKLIKHYTLMFRLIMDSFKNLLDL